MTVHGGKMRSPGGRPLIIFLLIAAAAAAFFALPEKASATTEITVWAMGLEGEMLGTMAVEFEKANPDIRVRVQSLPWDNGHDKLVTSVIGNVPPDMCQMGTTWMAEFHAMGALEPLDGYAAASGALRFDQFFDGTLMPCRYGGKYYGVPWYVDVRLFFYRSDLLASYGITKFPDTWDEFSQALKTIKAAKKARGEKGYAVSFPATDAFALLAYAWQNGGDMLDESRTICTIDSPQVLEALKYMKRVFDEGYSPFIDNTEFYAAFESGYYPIFMSGPWTMSDLERLKPNLNGKWMTAVCPKNRNRLTFVGGSDLVIFKDSKHKAEAFRFLTFLSEARTQAKWYAITRDLPSNKKAWQMDEVTSYPPLQAFGRQLFETRTPPNIPEWAQMNDIIYYALEEMMFAKITPEAALEKIRRRSDDLLARSGRHQSAWFKFTLAAAICLFFAIALALYFMVYRGGSDRLSDRKYNCAAYLFLAPSLGVMAVFLFLPILSSFIMSLTNWDIYGVNDWSKIVFVGFENYRRLLADPVFYHSMRNTFVYAAIGVPLNVALSLMAAIVLNQTYIRFKGLFRLGFFLPVITTFVAVSVTWRWLFSPDIGIVNWFIGLFGASARNWLFDEHLALPAIALMGVWKGFGYNMMIFIAALQSISDEIYEAAAIDGAGKFQQFFYITLPLLRKTTFFVCVITVIGSLHVFAEPLVMTGGGPLNSTMSIVLYMYNHGFKYYNLGYSSAIAYALFVVMAVVTFLQFRLAKRFEN